MTSRIHHIWNFLYIHHVGIWSDLLPSFRGWIWTLLEKSTETQAPLNEPWAFYSGGLHWWSQSMAALFWLTHKISIFRKNVWIYSVCLISRVFPSMKIFTENTFSNGLSISSNQQRASIYQLQFYSVPIPSTAFLLLISLCHSTCLACLVSVCSLSPGWIQFK